MTRIDLDLEDSTTCLMKFTLTAAKRQAVNGYHQAHEEIYGNAGSHSLLHFDKLHSPPSLMSANQTTGQRHKFPISTNHPLHALEVNISKR